MNIRLLLTILISKVLIKACRLLNTGGTTLPGKIAKKVYPGILKVVASNFRIIAVTGTNGKTTTARIIGQILKENGIDYITNKSGANLESGIITAFVQTLNFQGTCHASTALIEIDEAAFGSLAVVLQPQIVVVTNFFRDQLDRYGELYTTLKGVDTGIRNTEKSMLVLNADDSLCASLGKDSGKTVSYYGISENSYNNTEEIINNDAIFCIYCKTKYQYSSHVYAHLGNFKCPECGYSRPTPDIVCTGIEELTDSNTTIEFYAKQTYKAKLCLPGLYNIYNALAAIACGNILGLPVDNTIKALETFECGFGRMETINVSGKNIKIILVKNPTGFNQVLDFLLTKSPNMQIAFLINDRLADGTDISWLWDVNFEKLQNIQNNIDTVYASGIRANDMALRLKYSGIYTDKIKIVENYNQLINTALSTIPEKRNFYILPTYTAMLDIRKILKNKYKLKEFWK